MNSINLDQYRQLISDHHREEEIFYLKDQHRTSDNDDSGTEEVEQFYLNKSTKNDLTTKSVIDDEGFSKCEIEKEQCHLSSIELDLNLAKTIRDEMKKDFCEDTKIVFHGEFARLISIRLFLSHHVHYFLFTQEQFQYSIFSNQHGNYLKLDNAKAQFQCINPLCQHAWTSMRARISFLICGPQPGLVILNIFGQNCQQCGTHVHALWYIDEVCRVMNNLAQFIFQTYFPQMISHQLDQQESLTNRMKSSRRRRRRHDPNQRQGQMLAPHVKQSCQACRHQLCFQ